MIAIDVDTSWRLVIDDERPEAASRICDVIDPSTTNVFGHPPEATAAHAGDVVDGA